MIMTEQNKIQILIVDDTPANIHVLAEALGDDYDILIATDGEKALELSNRHDKPDIILLDIMMPEMDGYEVCRRLQENAETGEIPVIFVTALMEQENEIQGLDMGAVDYITKPIIPSIVSLRVRNQLELKRQRDLLIRQKLELEAALAKVKLLEGFIPICMYCKKIRKDDNAWEQMELYISQHSEAKFSHGICPECFSIQKNELQKMKSAGKSNTNDTDHR
jgi:response regulator RpfG family c-di-GMP phosphodiesterase